MKCAAVAAWSAILLVGVATAAFSAQAQGDPSPSKGGQAQAAKSLETVFGKTLIAIDGSTIEIIASEGRISREIVAPNGAVQRSNFVFINARLGTVADSRDAGRVTGVFRASNQEILVQYGDGSSEIVLPNPEGGITIETTSPKNPTYCTSWYPEGHVFSLDDRRRRCSNMRTAWDWAFRPRRRPDLRHDRAATARPPQRPQRHRRHRHRQPHRFPR